MKPIHFLFLFIVPCCFLFLAAAPAEKTTWLGFNPVIAEGTNYTYHPISNIELGLRSDGVVVWRKLEDK